MPTSVCSYASVSGLLSRTPYIGSAANVSSADIAAFISDAQAIVNGKIGRRYALPLTVEAPLLTQLTTELAIIDLCRKRIMFHFSKEDLSAAGILTRYKDAMEMLDDIAEGKLDILTDVGSAVAVANREFWSTTLGYNPTFHEGDQHLDVQDPDKIENIYSDRGML